ncbi:MAG TPA: HAMP domain-containing sensor histidine kinase [Candidatus Cybelea sp.]|jgi:signal transduction histidine kinase|nr:HAMP domain-containing sensor histidine kinase [Candidatus Cybelea sp.]
MSVRARFTVTVVTIVAVTVALFASLSIVALDRTLRSGFEARLHSNAQAIATAVDVHEGRISLDPSDLRALDAIHADMPFGVYASDGTQVAGDAPPPRQGGVQTSSVAVKRGDRTFGRVMVWQSDLWIGEFDRDAAIVSIGVGLLLIALGIIASRRVAQRVLAPLSEIASLAERIESYDLSGRLRADGHDELGRLCASFDRMLDRLQSAFSRERRFVADASHELRAPLAVLRAETDLALRRERSPGQYRDALTAIAREAARLEELIDELLAAARAEVDARQAQTLDASELVRALSERVRPAAATRGMAVSVETPGTVLVQGDRATLERALLAIMHNAIAYGPDDGIVHLRTSRNADAARIEVADDGPGFTKDALAHATERFWRGDTAHPRGGTGLGLAIARTIVEANRGSLQLSNGPGGGAVVTIKLAAPLDDLRE